MVADAIAPLERVQITGGVLVNTAKMRFLGSQGIAIASATQVLEHMRNDGAWRQLCVASPRGGEEPTPIYLHRDQSLLQRRMGYARRNLRRPVEKEACEQKHLGEFVYDPREKLVSVDMQPLVEIDASPDVDKVKLQWFDRAAAKMSAASVGEVTRRFAGSPLEGRRRAPSCAPQ